MPDVNACRVCGWNLGGPGWAPSPQYIICACCGAESGVDDLDERQASRYLLAWISKGGGWFLPQEMPEGWSLLDHLDRTGLSIKRSELRGQ